ncbi:MAG: excinuclease ABC subunit UvrA [Myxococcota bacterium]
MDIRIRGASEHNLQHVDLDLPREKLVVFTGPSGSGKSSLAFDTLHAESQRRFVEALQAYARQQLGATRKPAYELLTGLTPSIGVAQRGLVAPGPRATVATLTELHDLLRVLFARRGVQHCPRCGREVVRRTPDAIVRELMALPDGTRLVICAPVARQRTTGVKALCDELGRQGFARVRIDGQAVAIDELPALDARVPHDVDVVVDRVKIDRDKRDRLQDAVAAAITAGGGQIVAEVDGQDHAWSTRTRCVPCDLDLPALEPRLFSFNSPVGACRTCDGMGVSRSVDPDRLVDPERSLEEGAVDVWRGAVKRAVLAECQRRGIPTDVPWSRLPWEAREVLLRGDDRLDGALRLAEKTLPPDATVESPCASCNGARLNASARAVMVGTRSLPVMLGLTLAKARHVFDQLPKDPVTNAVREELVRRVEFLVRTGLGYLTLERPAQTLSGGELQRLRLGAQAGNQLSGVLYVLDEPTAGLHPEDTRALVKVLEELRDAGNTVLVVEHDPEVVLAADLCVDFGPGAGREGGHVTFVGSPEELLASDTLTGRWLSGREQVPGAPERDPTGWLVVKNARGHNLKGVDVRLPLGVLCGVTGVSGSGKSSLVEDTLARALAGQHALPHDGVTGREAVARVVRVDQSPLGRSSRSMPATATKVWDPIRQLYARTAAAKMRGFGPERFSLQAPGGRCEACQGEGVRRVSMQFLPDVSVTCEVCDGARFEEATLAVTWKGATVSDVLRMPAREARRHFSTVPAIEGPLRLLDELGLGYLPLGQPADTLSGGEAQRVKLARELGKPGEIAGTLYLLDEPAVGLHPADVSMLVLALRKLVAQGGSVIAVEHDPTLLRACDWIVELGPGAGGEGGEVVAEGAPAAVRATVRSRTGRYL